MDFLPELQRPWSSLELEMKPLGTAIVRASLLERSDRPDVVGRPLRDISTWPSEVWHERATVEFRFTDVFVLRYSEEHSSSEIESPEFEGATFRRYFDSQLLRAQRAFRSEYEHTFKHYQLNTLNDRIDIVCRQPPEIVLRGGHTGGDQGIRSR